MKKIKHSPESTDDQFNNRFMGSQMSRPAEGAFKGRSKNMSAVTVTFAATVKLSVTLTFSGELLLESIGYNYSQTCFHQSLHIY